MKAIVNGKQHCAELEDEPIDDDADELWRAVINAEFIDADIVEKGGKGSGNFSHAGRPGKIGGSVAGGNIRLPKGFSKDTAYSYAYWMIYHKPGESLPENLNEFDDAVGAILERGETYGYWAAETIDTIHIDELMADNPNLLEKSDREKLEQIAEFNSDYKSAHPGLAQPYRVVMEDSGKTDLEESKLGEWGITSPYQIRPANLTAVGWWENGKDGWTIHIAKNSADYGVSTREVFWHEFGHTIGSYVIEHFIGKPKALESAGEYTDRFAQYMTKH